MQGDTSALTAVHSGVPQGSVLIYIDDVDDGT